MDGEYREENFFESFAPIILRVAAEGPLHLKWIKHFQLSFQEPMPSARRAQFASNIEADDSSIRQHEAHQRHHARRETYEKHCMLQGQYCDRPQGPRRDDCRREVVESFRIFLFGCYFHGWDLARGGPTPEMIVEGSKKSVFVSFKDRNVLFENGGLEDTTRQTQPAKVGGLTSRKPKLEAPESRSYGLAGAD